MEPKKLQIIFSGIKEYILRYCKFPLEKLEFMFNISASEEKFKLIFCNILPMYPKKYFQIKYLSYYSLYVKLQSLYTIIFFVVLKILENIFSFFFSFVLSIQQVSNVFLASSRFKIFVKQFI